MKAIDFTCLTIVDRRRSAHLGVLPLGDKFYFIPLSGGVRRLVKKTLDCTVSFMVQDVYTRCRFSHVRVSARMMTFPDR